jgi:hypothetical protein
VHRRLVAGIEHGELVAQDRHSRTSGRVSAAVDSPDERAASEASRSTAMSVRENAQSCERSGMSMNCTGDRATIIAWSDHKPKVRLL